MMRRGMILALLTTIALAGCGRKGEKPGAGAAPPVVSGVKVEEARAVSVPDRLEAMGTIRPRTAATVAARIAGTVTSVAVVEGERVGRGKLLVTLDAVESTSGAAAAAAGMEEARRGVEEARSRLRLAETTFGRYRKLLDEQAVTRQEFDVKSTEREMAAESLARAEARLMQAKELSAAAGAVAGHARITAPIAGTVVGKSVEKGMTVFPGTILLTIEEEGGYRLEAAAPAELLGRVKVGAFVPVTVDGQASPLNGRVSEVAPTVDPGTRTFTVKLDVSAAGLRSGAFGRARFPAGERNGIVVPVSAVREQGALTSVWVVDKEKIARMRLVKAGKTVDGTVEILAGLSGGERVVTSGGEKVVDGAKVE